MKSFVIRNLLSHEEVHDLMKLKNPDWDRASSVGSGSGPSYDGARITEIAGFNYLAGHSIYAKIIKKTNELFNNKFYTNESINILKYDSRLKAKFDWHKDTLDFIVHDGNPDVDPEKFFLRNTLPNRKVSITIALNDHSSYNGGIFKLQRDDDINYENAWGEANARIIDLNTGDAVLFESDMYHQVTPVTDGIRYSAIIWLYYLEEFYEYWSSNDLEPEEGFDRFKRYYEEYDIPL